MADFEREACFWTSTTPGYNTRDRQAPSMRNGKRIVERIPQRGHAGDYEERRRAPGVRFVRVIDHHGHEICHTLTNAAAHLDHTAPYGQYAMQKARALGWFQPGACPCALLATGELKPDHIMSDDVRAATPCPSGSYSYEKPCPHSVAERKARGDENKRVQDEREAAYKSREDKLIEAMREQTAAVAAVVSSGKGKRE